MAQCIAWNGLQYVPDTSPPDSCGGYLILTADEYTRALNNPFNLTTAEASEIVGAVIAVWVVGAGFRWAIRTLTHPEKSEE